MATASALALAAAACGGGDDDSLRGPVLAGTPLPTATLPVPTPPVCDVENPLPFPGNLPVDVAIPPNYQIATIETDPFLKLAGRVKVPGDAYIPEDARGFLPSSALEVAMLDRMRAGWQFSTDGAADGVDYTFTHDDGRVGYMKIELILECPEYAALELEYRWLTEAAPPIIASPEAASPTSEAN